MATYHISAKREWEDFSHDGETYSMGHLKAHEVLFKGDRQSFRLVVSYGLHCFAKNDQYHTISVSYADDFEERNVDLERYHASHHIRRAIENLVESGTDIHEISSEKYFFIEMVNSLTGKLERYKIIAAFFKENRLLRMHVITAFFIGDSDAGRGRRHSVFKILMDIRKKKKDAPIPKEAKRGD